MLLLTAVKLLRNILLELGAMAIKGWRRQFEVIHSDIFIYASELEMLLFKNYVT